MGQAFFGHGPVLSSSLISESLDEFIAHWQIKRDNTRRGIVDLIQEE